MRHNICFEQCVYNLSIVKNETDTDFAHDSSKFESKSLNEEACHRVQTVLTTGGTAGHESSLIEVATLGKRSEPHCSSIYPVLPSSL